MYLSPADEERLRVFTAAELARRTIARGLRLNAPEAVALACDEMHLAARAGGSFGDVLAAGRRAVSPADLLPGVADLVDEIRLEVLLDDGSRLVVLRQPWGTGPDAPGAIRHPEEPVALNERRGLRLDIPAGSSVRWGPGEVKEIGLVRYGDDDEHPS